MRVLMAAMECAPFLQVGGVAEAVAEWCRALAELGHQVTLALPTASRDAPPPPPWLDLQVLDIEGCTPEDPYSLHFHAGQPRADRLARLVERVIDLCKQRAFAGAPFDVVHCNDWALGMVPYVLRHRRCDFSSPRTVFTVHCAEHLGLLPTSAVLEFGLAPEHAKAIAWDGVMNPLAAGVLAADAVTAPSPTYARELQSPELADEDGRPVRQAARARAGALRGILHGLDLQKWNPQTDPGLPAPFSADDREPRRACKALLYRELGWDETPEAPLLLFAGRLSEEKGLDALLAALPSLVSRGVRVLIAGRGIARFEALTRAAMSALAPQVAAFEGWAGPTRLRRLLASADLLLMPSLTEACGQTQMQAQRYGAVPVARRTGGLADTIVDHDDHPTTSTGFLFDGLGPEPLIAAVDRALAVLRTTAFDGLQHRAMSLKRSWRDAARAYEEVYRGDSSSQGLSANPRRFTFTFTWSGPPGRVCEFLCDVPGWNVPVPMPEATPGHYVCTVALPTGVFRYKFRVDGEVWHRDPLAHACDPTEGLNNGLFIVEGTTPPLVFSPDRRHLALYEDGRLAVHLEDGVSPSTLDRVEVFGERRSPEGISSAQETGALTSLGHVSLRPVQERWGRVLLRGESTFDLELVRPRAVRLGDRDRRYFRLPEPRTTVGRPPTWAAQAVFYVIFVDRWHRSAASPPDPRASPRTSPSTDATFFGGDLGGITEGLDYLQALGIDAIVLTPVHASPSPHRYDATDLMKVDPAVGGEEGFATLVRSAHARGLRVLADLSVTHVHEAHPAFQSVLAQQERSSFVGWFHVKQFPVRARDPETVACYPRKPHLPWLNLADPGARAHALAAALEWVRRGVDGLRLDAMHAAPDEFWRELRAAARALNPDLLFLGEVIYDRPGRYAEEAGLDTATDFAHREALHAFFFRGEIDAPELWRRLAFHDFRTGPFDPSFRVLFLDTHDTPRALSPDAPYARLRLALTYLLLRPEPVWLNYGTELALRGTGHLQLDDAWEDRLPMPNLESDATRTQRLVRALLGLRRELPELRTGSLVPLETPGRLLAFERRSDGAGVLRVLINAGETPVPIGALVGSGRRPLLSVEDTQEPSETIAPSTARVYRLS